MLGYEIGQQRLREVIVVQRLAGGFLNVLARGVHDLSSIGRKAAVAARHHIGLLHDLRGGFLERNAARARHPYVPIRPRYRAAFLGFHGLGPPLCTFADDADDVRGHVARPLSFLGHRRPPYRRRSR
jgi:hypothetical protein